LIWATFDVALDPAGNARLLPLTSRDADTARLANAA
jgi:hypothetical protein